MGIGRLVTTDIPSFRKFCIIFATLVVVGSAIIERENIAKMVGMYDHFAVRPENYSRTEDVRDTPEIIHNQLYWTNFLGGSGALLNGEISLYSRVHHPIEPGVSYRMSLIAQSINDGSKGYGGSLLFAGLVFYDENAQIITTSVGTHSFGVAYQVPVSRNEGRKRFEAVFSEDRQGHMRIPHDARYVKLVILANYSDPDASMVVSNVDFGRVR